MDENPGDDCVRQTLTETAVRYVRQLRRQVSNSLTKIIFNLIMNSFKKCCKCRQHAFLEVRAQPLWLGYKAKI